MTASLHSAAYKLKGKATHSRFNTPLMIFLWQADEPGSTEVMKRHCIIHKAFYNDHPSDFVYNETFICANAFGSCKPYGTWFLWLCLNGARWGKRPQVSISPCCAVLAARGRSSTSGCRTIYLTWLFKSMAICRAQVWLVHEREHTEEAMNFNWSVCVCPEGYIKCLYFVIIFVFLVCVIT